MKFSLEKAPHLTSPRSTRKIMTILSIALLVLGVYAIVWYFVNAGSNYGVNAILIFVVSVLTSVLCDALWAIPELKNKKVKSTKERLKNWGLKILDSYGYVSGLIFALLLPVGTTLYVVFIGAFIGTFLVKSIFGGFGKNIFNPAITARMLVGVSFPSALSTTLGDDVATTIASGASITTTTSNLGWTTNLQGISLGNMLLGNYRGTLGETFALVIVILGIALVALKVIDWRIPTFYIASLFLTTLVMGLASGLGIYSFEFGLRNILLGGALFGAVFCLTDPVTSPTSRQGKIIFAVGAALLTALIRYQASSVEGVGFSIMLMNILTPLIDRLCVSNSNKNIAGKVGTISGIVALSLVFGGVYGNLNKTTDTYSTTVDRIDDHMDLYDIALEIANKNAYGYEVVDTEVVLEHGTCLEKINFTLDDSPASYYKLMTDPKDSYNYLYPGEGNEPTDGYIIFGIVVNENGVVGYKYIDGTENSLGIEFATQISITPEYPYTSGDLTSVNAIVETGSSSAVNSFVTVPSILKTMQDAEKDFGLTIANTSVPLAIKEEY
ncbi:MAG: RnfABCDGE type electron transport complex subunit D [Bacilli bacterium]